MQHPVHFTFGLLVSDKRS